MGLARVVIIFLQYLEDMLWDGVGLGGPLPAGAQHRVYVLHLTTQTGSHLPPHLIVPVLYNPWINITKRYWYAYSRNNFKSIVSLSEGISVLREI